MLLGCGDLTIPTSAIVKLTVPRKGLFPALARERDALADGRVGPLLGFLHRDELARFGVPRPRLSPPTILTRCICNLMPVFPCRCFGLMPSSAIFGLSRQPQQRPLGFRDLLVASSG